MLHTLGLSARMKLPVLPVMGGMRLTLTSTKFGPINFGHFIFGHKIFGPNFQNFGQISDKFRQPEKNSDIFGQTFLAINLAFNQIVT